MAIQWPGRKEFATSQAQMAGVLLVAYIGNIWEPSYHRNENHNMTMFWIMNGILAIAAFVTLKHDANASSRGVQLLSRAQTEEWKGWMQFAFIMYHYYRAYSVYNIIRVFVSAYVWMTGKSTNTRE
jgi:N-acetylneuraminate 9-O-acetyltransferase